MSQRLRTVNYKGHTALGLQSLCSACYSVIISEWGYIPISLEFLTSLSVFDISSLLLYLKVVKGMVKMSHLLSPPYSTSSTIKRPLTYLNFRGSCSHWPISAVLYNFYGCKVQNITHYHLKIHSATWRSDSIGTSKLSMSCALGNTL